MSPHDLPCLYQRYFPECYNIFQPCKIHLHREMEILVLSWSPGFQISRALLWHNQSSVLAHKILAWKYMQGCLIREFSKKSWPYSPLVWEFWNLLSPSSIAERCETRALSSSTSFITDRSSHIQVQAQKIFQVSAVPFSSLLVPPALVKVLPLPSLCQGNLLVSSLQLR